MAYTPKELEEHIKKSIKNALQGLAYWISYRQVLYRWHSLNEGALVVEFVNLLIAKLGNEFKIECEAQYEKSGKERMDVEIVRKDEKGGSRVAIIEFKRYLAGITAIEKDMEKLWKRKRKKSDIQCFLVVVSEEKLPLGYVKESGMAIRGNANPKGGFSAKVIRVLKSTGALKSHKKKEKKPSKVNNQPEMNNPPKANYCCLIEILP